MPRRKSAIKVPVTKRPRIKAKKTTKPSNKTGTKLLPLSAMKKARARHRAKPSGLETAVHKLLDTAGIPYEKQKQISQCHVDLFMGPKTVIELNGCYWHACMVCHKALSDEQKTWQLKDAARYHFFKARGYDIVVVWEHDVRDHPERVQAMLRGIYESTQE